MGPFYPGGLIEVAIDSGDSRLCMMLLLIWLGILCPTLHTVLLSTISFMFHVSCHVFIYMPRDLES